MKWVVAISFAGVLVQIVGVASALFESSASVPYSIGLVASTFPITLAKLLYAERTYAISKSRQILGVSLFLITFAFTGHVGNTMVRSESAIS